jgi:hypothetical protein
MLTPSIRPNIFIVKHFVTDASKVVFISGKHLLECLYGTYRRVKIVVED